MSLTDQINSLATAIGAKIKTMTPRLLPAGGTTGQVLSKTSATDYAAGWGTLVDTSGSITPARLGMLAWTAVPDASASGRTLGNSTALFAACYPGAAVPSGTVVTLGYQVSTAGVGMTYARIGLYLYNTDGTITQIGLSADQATPWASLGGKTTTITTTAAIPVGATVYVGILSAGSTTAPVILGANVPSTFLGSPRRSGFLTTATLPSSATLSAMSAYSPVPFFSLNV